MSERCDDPRCRIPEHRGGPELPGGWVLNETERLTLRNTLLANQDMELTAAEATAAAWVIKPAVERMSWSFTTAGPIWDRAT